MKKLRFSLLAACAGLALSLSACTSSDAPEERATKESIQAAFETALAKARSTTGPGAPVLWSLADEDTTVYFFGTVHLLRPELEWRTDEIDAAIVSADKLVFEVDMQSEAAQRAVMTDFLARGMFEDGRTLKSVLPDEEEAVIAEAFDSIGVPLDAMNTFEPWMASLNLGVLNLQKDGYDPNSGVENVLYAEGAASGKTFGYLESIDKQADAFDLLPEDVQISMLYETALMMDESTAMLDHLVDEWAEGDVEGLAALGADPDGVGMSDAAYQAILVTRNKAWVPQIEEMLETPGTVFIAVGAAHFAGPDSVITMLRDKGYDVKGP